MVKHGDVRCSVDLADLVERQIRTGSDAAGIWNAGGGRHNAMSLGQLRLWCAERFGRHVVLSDPVPRRWDVPWLVMDSARAHDRFGCAPGHILDQILDAIAFHHLDHPEWLKLTESL